MDYRRALVLAPHTDDAELGCGGTLARLLEGGTEVHAMVFSTASDSLPEDKPPDTLKQEFFAAADVLGLDRERCYVYDYTVRRLSYSRQEVLEEMVRVRRSVEPDLVLLPSGHDLHQDHKVVHTEGLRAFKEVTVLGYELPWNHISFDATAFVTLEPRHLEAKWNALQAYKSQFELGRPYFSRSFIEGLARVRGTQVKVEIAEAFEVLRIKF